MFRSSNSIKLSVVANFFGRGWAVLLAVLVVPIYLKLLGIEVFGLIGFYTSLQAMMMLFDFGLGGALNRELARRSVFPDKEEHTPDLVRTLEYIYWGTGGVIGLVLISAAPFISNHWLKTEHLSSATLEYALYAMAIAISLQWPSSLYAGGLMGLQRQVVLNAINIFVSSFRILGSVLAISILSPSVEVFFSWQIAASAVQTGLTAFVLWMNIPVLLEKRRPRFRFSILKRVWRFAGNLSITSIMAAALGQVDKFVVSAILPLSAFGYYMLAHTIASVLNLFPAPIGDAVFPRYTQLVAAGDDVSLHTLFHKNCQLIAGLVFPVAAVLFFFSEQVIWLWTGDIEIARLAHESASLLVLGFALGTMMSTLDVVEMAYGWLVPAFTARFLALVLLVPGMWVAVHGYGVIGAAAAWLLVYVCYLVFTPMFVFSKIMPGQQSQWYIQDWILPLLLSFSAAGLGAWIVPTLESKQSTFLVILLVWACAFLLAASVLASYREIGSRVAHLMATPIFNRLK